MTSLMEGVLVAPLPQSPRRELSAGWRMASYGAVSQPLCGLLASMLIPVAPGPGWQPRRHTSCHCIYMQGKEGVIVASDEDSFMWYRLLNDKQLET